jgi:hypothetical protein
VAKQKSYNLPCTGDNTEICGTGGFMSLWLINNLASNVVTNTNSGNSSSTGTTTGGTPTSILATATILPATNIAALGCYSDVPGGALLPIFTDVPNMAIDQCA